MYAKKNVWGSRCDVLDCNVFTCHSEVLACASMQLKLNCRLDIVIIYSILSLILKRTLI